MTHAVTLPVLDGPLELLIELIHRHKIEVTAVSISRITRDYLNQVKAADMTASADEAGDFLQLGTRLLYIKSLALLPGAAEHDEQAVELGRLKAELIEYERFRTVAAKLARLQQQPSWTRGEQSRLDGDSLPTPDITPQMLAAAFARALMVAPPARPVPSVITRVISQAEMTARLQKRLRGGTFELQLLLNEAADRSEIVVLFAALLELMKERDVRVSQAGQFAPITIEAVRA